MAELTFKSPGVSTREIDLSGPTPLSPTGIPAGVIGTAVRGPAFVPVTVATFTDFINKFGNSDGEKFGPLAMREWLKSAGSGTYVRLLGVGDGKTRNADGSVTNAGFVVGEDQVQASSGLLANNPKAFASDGAGTGVPATMTLTMADAAAALDANPAGNNIAGDTLSLRRSDDTLKTFAVVHAGNDGSASAVATGDVLVDADDIRAGQTAVASGVSGATAIVVGPGTGGVAPKSRITFNAAADAGDFFTISVLTGGNPIKFVLEADAPGAPTAVPDTIKISFDAPDGVNSNITNLIALMNAIINKVDVTTVTVPAGAGAGGFFSKNDFAYASAGNGEAGDNFGFTASAPTATTLVLTSTTTTTAGNEITITNGGAGNLLLSNTDAGTPAGGFAGAAALGEGATAKLAGAIVSQGDLVDSIVAAVNSAGGFGSDGNGISAAKSAANVVTLTSKVDGDVIHPRVQATTIDNATLSGGNRFAGGSAAIANPGNSIPGRTYFLGCFMNQAAGSTIFSEAGLEPTDQPIVRAVLMTPGGVLPSLSSSLAANGLNNTVSSVYGIKGAFGSSATEGDAGNMVGDIEASSQDFTILLNGHLDSDTSSNTIKASFDPESPAYFVNKLNTDPTRFEELGHYLYAHYDVYRQLATPTQHGPAVGQGNKSTAFLLSSSLGRDAGTAGSADALGVPNYESFRDRYSAAFSPFVISQEFGGRNKDLFRFHALDDGAVGSGTYKITIENIRASDKPNTDFGSFDVLVRKIDDTDKEPMVLEAYRGLSLDHSSDRFIAKVIGDQHTFYDFDKKLGAQKLVVEGSYPVISSYVRVELSNDLSNDRLADSALPMGFRGLHHLVTSGRTATGRPILAGPLTSDGALLLSGAVTPPIPMRERISNGSGDSQIIDPDLTWGIQFEVKKYTAKQNKGKVIDASILSHTKFYPSFAKTTQAAWVGNNAGTPDVAGSVLDSDRFNNGKFSLERIQVITGSNGKPDRKQWAASRYSRDGVKDATLTTIDGDSIDGHRFLIPTDLSDLTTQKYMKFTFPLQGGFDGLNIFDKEKRKISNLAARREMLDSNQGLTAGPSIAAVRKAIDVMEERSDVDIQLLAIPGMRDPGITDYAMESVERRFDAMLLIDIDEYDATNTIISDDTTPVSVINTSNKFNSRNLDSSFAAAYAPDVIITDQATRTNVKCPPTVAALGIMSKNDSLSAPWFAPAGYTRATLPEVVEVGVKLNRPNLDDLYSARINPITKFPSSPDAVIFGQKTLIAVESTLDRINVRRLLIDIRRKVRSVANGLLFEPNRVSTLARFNSACTTILADVQQGQGVSQFKVNIDTTTTTQADVENNTIRGKIILQPVRSVEFVSLDFVVTNAGGSI